MADKQDAQGKGEVNCRRERWWAICWWNWRTRKALQEYEKSLKTDPNRFNGLYGAGHAAELSGEPGIAGRYFAQLLENRKSTPASERPELSRARAVMARN